MKKFVISVALVALRVGVAGISTPSRAETGQVAVVFTKGGFIVGVGGGEGVLVLRGKRYPFTVSGMSVGFTIGASTTKFVGRALNLKGPASIEGSYAVSGILLTVFRSFALLPAQQVVVASRFLQREKRHEKIWHQGCPGCLARGRRWHQYAIPG